VSGGPSSPAPDRAARPPRRGVVTALLVAAAVVTFLLAFASWANRQVLDTDEWTQTSSELLENEEIRDALAIYLVEELYANVDVEAEVRARLPQEAKPLAGPVSGGLREFAERVARRALEGPRVQTAWENLNRAAHERFVRIVKDEGGGAVSTAGGDVTLDLGTVVEQVGERVGIGGNLAEKLPPDAGQLTVLRSDQLDAAQDGADLIEGLVVVLLVLGLALYALALYLSAGRRRETLRAIAWIFVIVGLLVLVVRSIAGGVVVDELAKTAAVEPAAEEVWTIGTSVLAEIAGNLIVNGIIILVVAWVAGRTRAAVALRRAAAPYMRDRPALLYGLVAVMFLLMVAWGPTRAFRTPLSLLVIAGLLVVGTEALRRQAAQEFPDAALAEGEGLRETWQRLHASTSERISDIRAGRARRGAGAAAAAPEEARVEQLERLASLRERGVLSEAEFEREKSRLLS
jgi:hypothetical protein